VSRTIAAEHLGSDREIARDLHMDQVGGEKEHERGVQLATVDGGAGALQQGAELEAEDVDDLHRGLVGPDGTQRLQVRLAGLGGEDHELPDACPPLPGLDKFVHDPMQRAAAEGCAAREVVGLLVDSVLQRRHANDPELRREIVGQVLDDDGIAPERQVRAVLLGRAHRHDHGRSRAAAPAR